MSKGTKLSTCRRKTRFLSNAEARSFAAKHFLSQTAYRCNQCYLWHLTSAPRFERRSRERFIASAGAEMAPDGAPRRAVSKDRDQLPRSPEAAVRSTVFHQPAKDG